MHVMHPPRLAAAVRQGKRNVRVLIYEVLAGADAALPHGVAALCISQAELSEPLSVKASQDVPATGLSRLQYLMLKAAADTSSASS